LRGTDGPDVIVGLGGNDTISGLGGDDVICGDLGDDRIDGGTGSDSILGGKGDDMFLGDNPNGAPDPGTFDVCNGQQGTDVAVIGTCEHEGQMEGDIPLPEG
jgi:Ca2+-binding RTX toxin-like protein